MCFRPMLTNSYLFTTQKNVWSYRRALFLFNIYLPQLYKFRIATNALETFVFFIVMQHFMKVVMANFGGMSSLTSLDKHFHHQACLFDVEEKWIKYWIFSCLYLNNCFWKYLHFQCVWKQRTASATTLRMRLMHVLSWFTFYWKEFIKLAVRSIKWMGTLSFS